MSDLIPKHGGYRKLKSFQMAQLCHDITVRFCDKYINRRSRTHELIERRCQTADEVAGWVAEVAMIGCFAVFR